MASLSTGKEGKRKGLHRVMLIDATERAGGVVPGTRRFGVDRQ